MAFQPIRAVVFTQVHFPSAMPQSLLPWITTESDKDTGLGPLRARIFSSIKEAAFICQGSDGGKIVNMMEVSKRDSLWDCMLRVDWTGYKNCADVMGIDPTIVSLPEKKVLMVSEIKIQQLLFLHNE